MKALTALFLTISNLVLGQGSQRPFLQLTIDSIRLIEITDHQNVNYDWVYGRAYAISKSEGKFFLTLTSQYSRAFSFRQTTPGYTPNSVDLNNMPLLDKVVTEKNQDSLTASVENVVARRAALYSRLIKLDSIKIPTALREIEQSKVIGLIDAVTARKESFAQNILPSLGIDSAWLGQNAERLWTTYKPERFKISTKASDYCIRCLKTFTYAKLAAMTVQGSHATSDYPFVEIRLITSTDTIRINTDGQQPHMLPWNIDDRYKSFNPKLAIALAEILPYDDLSNRGRLMGVKKDGTSSFLEQVINGVIYTHCVDKSKKRKKWKLVE